MSESVIVIALAHHSGISVVLSDQIITACSGEGNDGGYGIGKIMTSNSGFQEDFLKEVAF